MLWLEGGNNLLGTPGLPPAPHQAHWEKQICKNCRDSMNSFMPQAFLFI